MLSARTLGLTFAILIGASTGANAANIVVNGGFETGDFTGWITPNSWQILNSSANGSIGGISAFQGDFFAFDGCANSTFCDLTQDLATNPNGTYNLSFEFNPGRLADSGNGEMKVFWDGAQIFDQAGGPLGWVHEQFNGLVASGNSTELRFSGFQNPQWSGIDMVDAEGVVSSPNGGGIPEPSTWALLLLGFAALGSVVRRQSRQLARMP